VENIEPTSGTKTMNSRKFMLALMAMATSCAAVLLGKITGGEYAMCLAAILGMYGAANVGSQFVKKP